MSEKSTIAMGEYRINQFNLIELCPKKRSITDYKSLKMLFYKTRIIELRLIRGKISILDVQKMLAFLVCAPSSAL